MSAKIKRMFSEIHGNYDAMNHVLSLGMDAIWRKSAAKESMIRKTSYRLIDIATGTGGLAVAVGRLGAKTGKRIEIHGVDFNSDMLGIARLNAERHNLKIRFEACDALKLNFNDNSFDVAASSFALRDFDSLEGFASESYRILKRGGKLVLLEIARPDNPRSRLFFRIYAKLMLLEGSFVNKGAYRFLIKSMMEFDKGDLTAVLKKEGFKRIRVRTLFSNAAFVITAYK